MDASHGSGLRWQRLEVQVVSGQKSMIDGDGCWFAAMLSTMDHSVFFCFTVKEFTVIVYTRSEVTRHTHSAREVVRQMVREVISLQLYRCGGGPVGVCVLLTVDMSHPLRSFLPREASLVL